MKKFLFLFAVASMFSMITVATAGNVQVAPSSLETVVSSYRITVVSFSGSLTKRVSATYDSDTNTITVSNKGPYKVEENPYYGSDDKRGSYRYVAAGQYYFNI